MEIIIAGDWHGVTPWVTDAVIPYANSHGIETIVQLGDFGYDWPGPKRFQYEIELSKKACLYNVKIVFIDGNHENHDSLDELIENNKPNKDGHYEVLSNLFYSPRGNRWNWDGVRFGSLGGAFSVDKEARTHGTSWWPQEDITQRDMDALGSEPLDVMFTHEAPYGLTPMDLYRVSGNLPQAVENAAKVSKYYVEEAMRSTEPKVLFHGHWHYFVDHYSDPTRIIGLDCERSKKNLCYLNLENLNVRYVDEEENAESA